MAKRDPNSYYNGSAAYDLYGMEGSAAHQYQTAAPQIDSPGLPEERVRPERRVRVKAQMELAPFAVIGLAVVTCMLILVVFGYVQLYEASETVSSLKSDLSDLMQEQVILESLYEGSIDLDYIEQRATEMGLGRPSSDQTVYLQLSGSDQAQIYAVEKVSFFQRIIQAIESSARGFVEYLS